MNFGPTVYVAGPYTKSDPCVNTYEAIGIGDEILAAGGVPFVPHLSHFWHTVSPKPYEVWTMLDFAWLRFCDALYRIEGDSPGADAEVDVARERGLPIFHDLSDCRQWIAIRLGSEAA